MSWTLAILQVLASDAGRRFTVDEISGAIRAQPDLLESIKKTPAFGDVDIFRSGMVSRSDAGWQITEAGLSRLHSPETASSVHVSSPSASPALGRDTIHELEALGELVSKFHPELEQPQDNVEDYAEPTRLPGRDVENAMAMGVLDRGYAPIDLDDAQNASDGDHSGALSELRPVTHLPPFLRRGAAGHEPQTHSNAWFSAIYPRLIAAKNLPLLQGLNLHSTRTVLAPKAGDGSPRALSVSLALFALFGIVAAAFLLSQVVSFKSENRLLQQELSKLRENLGRIEQMVKAEKEADRKKPGRDADLEVRPDQQSMIELSKDEILSIRGYISPAPHVGLVGPAINVGEFFEGATIPLPAPLMEKIPKLLGARFAIRNGAIVILKRGSDRVSAVLLPN